MKLADVVCLGEALIDFVALEACSDVGAASGFLKAPGGAPANVAVGIARLGRTSSFLGKVGDDPFGRFLANTFAEAGVDVSGVVFDAKHRTGLAFVSLTDQGERDFCFFRNPSADRTYSESELDLDAIDTCKAFHFGSITLIDAVASKATLAAARRARTAGKLISYDPNLRVPLWPSLLAAQKGMQRGMPLADIVKVSEEELAFLSSKTAKLPDTCPTPELTDQYARKLLKKFPNIAILSVTRGPNGCAWWTRTGLVGSLNGLPVQAVDTTGAGDGFVAGLLVGLLNLFSTANEPLCTAQLDQLTQSQLERLFTRANAVGALTTTRKGAIPALPTAEMLDRFLAG